MLYDVQTEARVQREWSEYCHKYYFSKDDMGMFHFSSHKEDTLWACAMVRQPPLLGASEMRSPPMSLVLCVTSFRLLNQDRS